MNKNKVKKEGRIAQSHVQEIETLMTTEAPVTINQIKSKAENITETSQMRREKVS